MEYGIFVGINRVQNMSAFCGNKFYYFVGTNVRTKNSRTFVLQIERLFYTKLYNTNKMECICGYNFFGVQMDCKICKPFVGTKYIMCSICRTLRRYARNVTASPHFLDYCRRLSDSKEGDHREPMGGFLWGGLPASVGNILN